ncbi:Ser/Thr protein kinase RdoA (MazF antagonist) [Bacillus mesophilus]|uniref:Phosphotransferase n=1 Tax=Bacillus mesophilus TaxID=1808955 RepID=A0A6M0QC39_9BACI|nr:phosphotransferase [Bacillus mesophilus]MBM7662026.1 Ser/Thr protein kinase RdoA (MazF antagonist) [Bacillus mesophilus]NEY72618.1 phosphotransferase [Bacillus mesophilus]
MEKLPKYLNKVLSEAISLYAINPDSLKNLNGNESTVFSYKKEQKEYILKITHSSHRTLDEILAEIDWLQYLDHCNIKVSNPIPSRNGHFVEKIPLNKAYYSIISYEKALGFLIDRSHFTPQIIKNWGSTMGRMHHATKFYKPSNTYNRKHWYENKYVNIDIRALPTVKRKYEEIKERLVSLPMGSNDYGLIHSDLHHRNFLLKDQSITVIDFDDAEYSWFINDIAKTLYNETFNFSVPSSERDEFASYFLDHFLAGYMEENQINPLLMQYFQDFLQLRHLFIVIRRFHTMNQSQQTKLTEKFKYDLHFDKLLTNIRINKT